MLRADVGEARAATEGHPDEVPPRDDVGGGGADVLTPLDPVIADRAPVVAKLAADLGIENWRAGLTPRDKAEACAEASARGRRVLMVGDGINDAPALSSAHVSMAPATASAACWGPIPSSSPAAPRCPPCT